MSEARFVTLGAITENYDSLRKPVRSSGRTSGPYPYYGASGIIDHVNSYLFDGNYLLVAEDGENLRTRSTPLAFLANGRFWANNHVHVLAATPRVNLRYLCYKLSVVNIEPYLTGSAQPKLSRRALDGIGLELHERRQQDAIAEVLGALDDKIEANRKLAPTADELAHLRFRIMVRDSEHRLPLSATARFVNGKAFTKNATGTGRVVIRISELNSGLGGSTVRNDLDVADDHLARPGDLLFAWSGSLTLARWFWSEGIVNQHIFKVVPREGYPLWLVNQLIRIKLDEFKAIAADKATTMGHIQRRHLDEEVSVPDPALVERADSLMTGLWARALAAEVESERLAELRDTLLPKLMSGELRVREAEAAVAAAV